MTIHQALFMQGGPFTASPTFYAPLMNTLEPTTATGGGTYAFGRASVAYVADWENLLKACKSGEARFTGARRVENLLVKTEAFADAAWTKVNMTVGSSVTDPLGGSTAFTLTASAGNAECYQSGAATTTQTRVSSIWARRRTGTGLVQLTVGTAGITISTSLTSSWQRFAVSGSATATSFFDIFIQTSGDAIDVWHPMYEDTTGQSNSTNPSEYVSVGVLSSPYHGANVDGVKYFSTKNGNTVASTVVTEATGAAINTSNGGSSVTTDATGPFGCLIEEARTQLIANPEAFGGAGWVVNKATITANSVAGPNGFTTADTLNEDNTTGDHLVARTLSKTATAITYTLSVYAKKAGRDWLFLSVDDGTVVTGVYFNVNTGAVGSTVAGNFTSVSGAITAAANGFYRCSMTFTTNTTTTLDVYLWTASADGTRNMAGINAAALYLWGCQLEVGSFVTSYLPDGLATRPYDGFTYSTFTGNASATAGTAYVETKTRWTTAAGVYPLLAFDIATFYPLYSNSEAATVIRANDGTNNVGKSGISSMATAVRKVAASWAGSLNVTGDGASAATGTFDGDMGSTAIGVGTPTTGSGVVWNGWIRNLKLYTVAATPTQLKTLTT